MDPLAQKIKEFILSEILPPISKGTGKTIEELCNMITPNMPMSSGINLSNMIKARPAPVASGMVDQPSVGQCHYRFSKGPRKDTYCGEPTSQGEEYCKKCAPRAKAKAKKKAPESSTGESSIEGSSAVMTPDFLLPKSGGIPEPPKTIHVDVFHDKVTQRMFDSNGFWLDQTADKKNVVVRGKRLEEGKFVETLTPQDVEKAKSMGYDIDPNIKFETPAVPVVPVVPIGDGDIKPPVMGFPSFPAFH